MVINAHFVPFPNYARVITRLARHVDASETRRSLTGRFHEDSSALSKISASSIKSRFHSTRDQNRPVRTTPRRKNRPARVRCNFMEANDCGIRAECFHNHCDELTLLLILHDVRTMEQLA